MIIETKTYTTEDGEVFTRLRNAEQYVGTLALEKKLRTLGWPACQVSKLADFLILTRMELEASFAKLSVATAIEVTEALERRRGRD